MKRVGIVAALEAEADAIFPGEGDIAGGVRTVMTGQGRVLIATSGIGKVNATIAATSLVRTRHVELLAVIGTAGALGERHGTFLIHEAVQCDYGAWRPEKFAHFRAGEWPIGVAACPPFAAFSVDSPLPRARIATSDAFVECTDRARYLRETLGCELVDMETGAVAQVAAALKVHWLAIKATTDGADGGSADNFNANLNRAARAAAEAMKELLQNV